MTGSSGASAQTLRELVRRVIAATRRLEQFPRSGRVVPEVWRDDTREIIISRYRVMYRLRDDGVIILAVRHGARLLDELPDS